MAHSYAPAPWTPGSVVSFEDRDWLVWSNAPSATAVWLHADDGTFVLVKKPTTRRGTGIPARRVGAGRGRHRRLRQTRNGDVLYGTTPVPPLIL